MKAMFAMIFMILNYYASAWCRVTPYSSSMRTTSRTPSSWQSVEIALPRTASDIFRMLDDADFLSNSLGSASLVPMPIDLVETKTGYEYIIDLPGVDKKDISLNLKGNELTITGERSMVAKSDEDVFRRVERKTGTASRTFALEEDADIEKLTAEANNGVLRITIPKQDAKIPKERKIEIN